MNKGILVLLAAAAVAFPAYKIAFRSATQDAHSMLQTSDGEMEWLRREFHLSDQQFRRVRELQANYQPTCMQLCGRIMKANQDFQQVAHSSRSVTPEVAAALKESLTVQEDCRQAMLGHIYSVSAEMNPEDGMRYLHMMLPRIVQPPLSDAAAPAHDHEHMKH